MNVQTRVLNILLHHTDSPISGQVLADKLEVSRNAVWKAIEQLRDQGYEIISQRNIGYQLTRLTKQLDASQIATKLDPIWQKLKVKTFAEVTSTNNLAKEFAIQHPGQPALFVSEKQSAGRGRHGRIFESILSSGLYFSLVIQPSTSDTRYIPRYTIAAATAIAQAVEAYTQESLQIKWVNDLFYKGHKVGGILSEATTDLESGSISAVVIGIGLNLAGDFSDASPEVAKVAGTIYGHHLPDEFNRNRLLNLFLHFFTNYHQDLVSNHFMPLYAERLLGLNQHVTYQFNNEPHEGILTGVNEEGHLLVKEATGEIIELTGQEIHLSSHQFINRK